MVLAITDSGTRILQFSEWKTEFIARRIARLFSLLNHILLIFRTFLSAFQRRRYILSLFLLVIYVLLFINKTRSLSSYENAYEFIFVDFFASRLENSVSSRSRSISGSRQGRRIVRRQFFNVSGIQCTFKLKCCTKRAACEDTLPWPRRRCGRNRKSFVTPIEGSIVRIGLHSISAGTATAVVRLPSASKWDRRFLPV